jgi:hypothetical protein
VTPVLQSHVPVGRRGQARGVTFKILEGLRRGDGSLTCVRSVRCAVAGLAPLAGCGGPGG